MYHTSLYTYCSASIDHLVKSVIHCNCLECWGHNPVCFMSGREVVCPYRIKNTCYFFGGLLWVKVASTFTGVRLACSSQWHICRRVGTGGKVIFLLARTLFLKYRTIFGCSLSSHETSLIRTVRLPFNFIAISKQSVFKYWKANQSRATIFILRAFIYYSSCLF